MANKQPSEDSTPVVAEPLKDRAIEWARAAEMVPDLLPGTKVQPVRENPKAWLYRAAKMRFQFDDETVLTLDEFNAHVAAVGSVLVR
jgi:hypothetical protein